MARKAVTVCDSCSAELQNGSGAVMRVNYIDARRGSKQADLCDTCAEATPGMKVARRGRKPTTPHGAVVA